MFGPSGRKAYTESVLRIIRDVGLISSPPPRYFYAYHETQEHTINVTSTSMKEKYTCPTQDTDYLRDRDIRKKKTINQVSHNYAVPTANRFNVFNQKNW